MKKISVKFNCLFDFHQGASPRLPVAARVFSLAMHRSASGAALTRRNIVDARDEEDAAEAAPVRPDGAPNMPGHLTMITDLLNSYTLKAGHVCTQSCANLCSSASKPLRRIPKYANNTRPLQLCVVCLLLIIVIVVLIAAAVVIENPEVFATVVTSSVHAAAGPGGMIVVGLVGTVIFAVVTIVLFFLQTLYSLSFAPTRSLRETLDGYGVTRHGCSCSFGALIISFIVLVTGLKTRFEVTLPGWTITGWDMLAKAHIFFAALGLGSLFLVWPVVAIFSQMGRGWLRRQVAELRHWRWWSQEDSGAYSTV